MKKENKSKFLLPVCVLGGIVLPVLSGAFLAIDYIGYPNAPTGTPIAPYILLPVGLIFGAAGQRLLTGRWESSTVHIMLAYAGLAYLVLAVKYAMAGRPIHGFPAGFFAIVSGILVISRLLAKTHEKYRKPSISK